MKKLYDWFLLFKAAVAALGPGPHLWSVFGGKRFFILLLSALIAHAVRAEPAVAPAQVSPPLAIYASRCAMCHGPNLEGAAGPPLITVDMRDRALPALKARMSATMPLDAPGALSEAEYEALTNYIAIRNGR